MLDEPSGEASFSFFKVCNAKAFAACLSRSRVEPGPAPVWRVWTLGKPVFSDLATAVFFRHLDCSRQSASCASVYRTLRRPILRNSIWPVRRSRCRVATLTPSLSAASRSVNSLGMRATSLICMSPGGFASRGGGSWRAPDQRRLGGARQACAGHLTGCRSWSGASWEEPYAGGGAHVRGGSYFACSLYTELIMC